MLNSIAEKKLPHTINTAPLRILLRVSGPSRATTNRSKDSTACWICLIHTGVQFEPCQGISACTFKSTVSRLVVVITFDTHYANISNILEYLCLPQTYNRHTRKQRPEIFIEAGAERPLKRAPLTKKNLKAFEKWGKQKNSAGKEARGQLCSSATTTDKDFGSQCHHPKSGLSGSGAKSTRSRQTTSETESDFQDIAFQNGLLNPHCAKPPVNLESRREKVDRSRCSASPTESDYQRFASAIRRAPNEASILYETSALLQCYEEPGYHKSFN